MDFAAARRNMVASQIRTNRVTDGRIISALGEIPREVFVAEEKAGIAYVDEALALGGGRYLMEPMAFALLLQAADIGGDDVVLDIGCATGYSSAVLAHLAGTVVALEEDAAFAARATELLAELKIDNVAVMEGPLTGGYGNQAPYNAIVFSGAVAEVPGAITGQLADGGRLVCIEAGENGIGRGIVVGKYGESVSRRHVFDAGSPILPGFERHPAFSF
ncbi:MAG: protein-L-isoaspartate O-methyltransferase [Rhodospirillales bacterium]|nr:protein-L-isoaspartate O-methyltransferase [Rhodospirillales bacterium]MDP6643033.1 protein-L-isoaspartate O-methyltransferase [Rhodospirillales bacterium]MDP6842655.1 protein-L-isoaspartate O-methyltransferase [Rhodospirillales bacterium]